MRSETDWSAPRVYRTSPAALRVQYAQCVLWAIVMAGSAIWSIDQPATMGARLGMGAFAVLSLLFLFIPAAMAARHQVSISPHGIEQRTLFGIRRLRAEDIVGYYARWQEDGPSLRFEARRRLGEDLEVSLPCAADEAFTRWLAAFPDLSGTEEARQLARVRSNGRLGSGPAQREEHVRRARALNTLLAGNSVVLAAWAVFYPQPYLPLVAALAALPWLAILLCWCAPNFYSLRLPAPTSWQAWPGALLFLPGIALMLRSLLDVEMAEGLAVLPPAFALALCLCLLTRARHDGAAVFVFMYAVLCAPYAVGTIRLANTLLDKAAPVQQLVAVEERMERGRRAPSPFRFVRTNAQGGELAVPDARDADAMVCLQTHPGALGMAWYGLRDRAACASR